MPDALTIQATEGTQQSDRSRRIKIMAVSDTTLVTMLNAHANAHEYLIAPVFPDLPTGYVVETVFWDNPRQCFGVVVSHESWIEVGIGEACEWIGVLGWDTYATAYKRMEA